MTKDGVINSRQKGARGEREWSLTLRNEGYEARRGQQFSGLEGEDVVSNLPFHWEVKRVERLNLQDAIDQARRDAKPGVIPAVAWRKNHCKWNVTLDADDFFLMLRHMDDETLFRELEAERLEAVRP